MIQSVAVTCAAGKVGKGREGRGTGGTAAARKVTGLDHDSAGIGARGRETPGRCKK